MATLGEILKKRRNELGMTMDEVASALDIAKVTVYRWEHGITTNMGKNKIEGLSRLFQIPVEDLMQFQSNDQIIWQKKDLKDEASEEEKAERDNQPEQRTMLPQQEILFDASADLTQEEMNAVLAMIAALKATRRPADA